ncbi:kelch-like protein [Volepox virus]|uniref:Kelch-like protein n=1 Tax=Volepox virus TaxID=28874 RepID=A0A1C9KCJ2_9POXV|nr:kelch-like protein [Volepox virus]AOP31877.1 kelch-like protein [Volepox virus]
MDSITITVGQSVISSNTYTLINKSSYFAEILKCGYNTDNITLYDFQEDAIVKVIQFINTDIIKLESIKEAAYMIYHSKQLGVESLLNECQIYLLNVLRITNCLEIYRLIHVYSLKHIHNEVRNFMLDNILTIYLDPDFIHLPKYVIIDLLSDDYLNVFNEDNVVKIIYKYISSDMYKDISDILPVVRWNYLSAEWLTDIEWKLGNIDRTITHKKRCYCSIITVNYNNDKGLLVISKHQPNLESEEFTFSIKTDICNKFETIYLNKKIYIIGGIKCNGEATNQVFSIDIVTKKLTIEPPLNDKKIGAAITVVNGRIYVIGGCDGQNYLNTVESWRPGERKWRYEVPMNYKRSECAAISVNDTIFVTGGMFVNDSNDIVVINNMEKFVIGKEYQWDVIDMPMAKVYHGIQSTFGMLYFAGGLYATDQYRTIESNNISCYNPRTNKWYDMSYTNYKRRDASLCKLNNMFYIFSQDGHVEKYDGEWKIVHNNLPAIKAYSTSPY